jgi:predicted nucleic acid-binding protein
VVQVLSSNELLHESCVAYMQRLAAANSTVYFNRLLEIELAEVAFKLAVIERHGKRGWPTKRSDGRVRRRAGRLTAGLMTAWTDLLSTVPHLRIELHEVSDLIPAAMRNWGLASYDAVHAVTAGFVQADGLVTTDAGFGSIPTNQLRIYTDDSRLRSCRQRRGGR